MKFGKGHHRLYNQALMERCIKLSRAVPDSASRPSVMSSLVCCILLALLTS